MKKLNFICVLMVIICILSIGLGLAIWAAYEKHENNIEYQAWLISEYYKKGYLDACKDFYKGKTKYDLVKNDDGTVLWKKVDK